MSCLCFALPTKLIITTTRTTDDGCAPVLVAVVSPCSHLPLWDLGQPQRPRGDFSNHNRIRVNAIIKVFFVADGVGNEKKCPKVNKLYCPVYVAVVWKMQMLLQCCQHFALVLWREKDRDKRTWLKSFFWYWAVHWRTLSDLVHCCPFASAALPGAIGEILYHIHTYAPI